MHTAMSVTKIEVSHAFISQKLKKLKEKEVCQSAHLAQLAFYNCCVYFSVLHEK